MIQDVGILGELLLSYCISHPMTKKDLAKSIGIAEITLAKLLDKRYIRLNFKVMCLLNNFLEKHGIVQH